MYAFILTALAVWRVASLLVSEDGPGEILAKLRSIVGVKYDQYSNPYGTNLLSGILSCVWCCSVWIGFLASALTKPRNFAEYLRNSLALSASAILIEGIANKHNG